MTLEEYYKKIENMELDYPELFDEFRDFNESWRKMFELKKEWRSQLSSDDQKILDERERPFRERQAFEKYS